MNSICSVLQPFKLDQKPIFVDQIAPIDFKNTHKLPETHKWSTNYTINYNSIPIIDLSKPNAIGLIKEASENWGMFQVTNHGIQMNLLNQIQYQTKRLFALPAERKLLAVRSPGGFAGYGVARISNFFPKKMWYEGFTITGGCTDQHATQLWPDHPSSFCEVMEEYKREAKGVSERIIGLMFKSLGLSPEDTKWFRPKNEEKGAEGIVQLNSYPVCPEPERAMGLAPHTDSSLLTVLHQNETNGLQVLREGIGWVGVQPMKGALVVNVGDMMHIISNGRFKSAKHQAVVSKTDHRLSIAYFYGPPKDVKISAPLKLIDNDHPIIYPSVSWKEYLDAKAIHFNNALHFLKFHHFTCNQF